MANSRSLLRVGLDQRSGRPKIKEESTLRVGRRGNRLKSDEVSFIVELAPIAMLLLSEQLEYGNVSI